MTLSKWPNTGFMGRAFLVSLVLRMGSRTSRASASAVAWVTMFSMSWVNCRMVCRVSGVICDISRVRSSLMPAIPSLCNVLTRGRNPPLGGTPSSESGSLGSPGKARTELNKVDTKVKRVRIRCFMSILMAAQT
ncbi:uncharacterized protein BO95DRAFT_296386 [Aspergillus brunneoviolaceus CBS 621.78]|uniref:Uncharacterized protein n=1 Tax=Aspergillus brunneoviolaceus CBS 621.78 TaxID=1450534 RepID=A0ACD1FUE0_9EURO|nr:hypothetical protein BO95DRAFT_296386 [Aspergillus brunneoviolaceus CBS 621.78]RAH40583.1 hypothetical protein BO95DRAFT_296386 [Aspergillus brunneoviolaceus CBS 621.78]